ncbi:MAG: hypothetical protein ACR2KD_05855 [Thermoleophilaceae bacterium]|nr:hypothetical protein [Thermoleophilaceae bacterium]MBA3840900.1 hypothetical protein [Thermoleophilaceae bacterium]
METLSAAERRRRARVESVIRIISPGLDLILAVGDRVSRIVEREDPEYYPARVEGMELAPPPARERG